MLPLVGENPVTGIGFEMVRETTPEHEPPHDVFVQTLVEGGIAAFLAFVALLITLGFDLRNAWRSARRGFQYGLTVATIAASIGLLAELLTENILSEVALLWYFIVPVAWVLSVVGRPGPVARDPRTSPGRASALSAPASTQLARSASPWPSDAGTSSAPSWSAGWTTRQYSTSDFADARVERLETAADAEPRPVADRGAPPDLGRERHVVDLALARREGA